MGIKQLYDYNLRKLQNEYGDVSGMAFDDYLGLVSGTSRFFSTLLFGLVYSAVRASQMGDELRTRMIWNGLWLWTMVNKKENTF